MKSVQFVGLLVCLQYAHDCIFVNSVDLSSQTQCFFCWIHGGGGGDGTT